MLCPINIVIGNGIIFAGNLGMKKIYGYAAIILPVVALAVKWQIWNSNLEAVVLPLVATLVCTVYDNEQREKKED